jgi:hypothetical protein
MMFTHARAKEAARFGCIGVGLAEGLWSVGGGRTEKRAVKWK